MSQLYRLDDADATSPALVHLLRLLVSQKRTKKIWSPMSCYAWEGIGQHDLAQASSIRGFPLPQHNPGTTGLRFCTHVNRATCQWSKPKAVLIPGGENPVPSLDKKKYPVSVGFLRE